MNFYNYPSTNNLVVQHAASGSSLAGTNENGKGRQECTLYGIGRQSYYVATCIAVLASALIIYTVCMHGDLAHAGYRDFVY